MGTQTRSKFYYGHDITENNQLFVFNEGASDIEASIPVDTYSLTDFVTTVQRSMNAVGGQIYTVTFNRTTRIINITAPGTFSLLVSQTGEGNNAYPFIGITSDKTGSNDYDCDVASGSEYLPQFWLQNYISFEHNKEFKDGSVKESASGEVEIVSFGLTRYMECEIVFANNYSHKTDSPIENNQSGVSDIINFMDYAIKKGPIEFMVNRDVSSSYSKCILDKTAASSAGVGYKLKELFSKKLSGYYDTGSLKFREL